VGAVAHRVHVVGLENRSVADRIRADPAADLDDGRSLVAERDLELLA